MTRFLWMLVAIPLGLVTPELSAGDTPRIEWNRATQVLVQKDAGYGRMIRLKDGTILCSYYRGGKVRVRRSDDEGKTWGKDKEGEITAATFDFGEANNPELLQLANGWVLLSWNERPRIGTNKRFAIRTRISQDGGLTWEEPVSAYEADTRFENGCWEPAQIQLPSGEVQLFFANESPYRESDEQEITVVKSLDNGKTWGKPQQASFRRGKRDGMPVPLLLGGGRDIVLAIEDNGLSGTFKPSIVASSVTENWSHPRRWGAMATPLPPTAYAGAPYLRQMPDGTTVLSVQCNQDRREPWMVVYVGDDEARNFANPSAPFEVPPDVAGRWNALFVKDRATITAISGTTIDGIRGVWAIDGKLGPR